MASTDPGVANPILREYEERFRATFEQGAVGMAHVGLDGTWLRINERLLDILGYSRPEILERTFQAITHPDHLDADLAVMRELLAGERSTYGVDKRYIRKSGDPIWVHITVSLARLWPASASRPQRSTSWVLISRC
jgi:PAS domain S-box-containing protein